MSPWGSNPQTPHGALGSKPSMSNPVPSEDNIKAIHYLYTTLEEIYYYPEDKCQPSLRFLITFVVLSRLELELF